ncbi:hypothetical protein Syun_006288 [Stephania yunnanensis]|uniref:Uncharacterized protein n=1 Tax=Stephania yunnanensis TaxID=152371 RepID=A0AAP0KXZ3_9MAGN
MGEPAGSAAMAERLRGRAHSATARWRRGDSGQRRSTVAAPAAARSARAMMVDAEARQQRPAAAQ